MLVSSFMMRTEAVIGQGGHVFGYAIVKDDWDNSQRIFPEDAPAYYQEPISTKDFDTQEKIKGAEIYLNKSFLTLRYEDQRDTLLKILEVMRNSNDDIEIRMKFGNNYLDNLMVMRLFTIISQI